MPNCRVVHACWLEFPAFRRYRLDMTRIRRLPEQLVNRIAAAHGSGASEVTLVFDAENAPPSTRRSAIRSSAGNCSRGCRPTRSPPTSRRRWTDCSAPTWPHGPTSRSTVRRPDQDQDAGLQGRSHHGGRPRRPAPRPVRTTRCPSSRGSGRGLPRGRRSRPCATARPGAIRRFSTPCWARASGSLPGPSVSLRCRTVTRGRQASWPDPRRWRRSPRSVNGSRNPTPRY